MYCYVKNCLSFVGHVLIVTLIVAMCVPASAAVVTVTVENVGDPGAVFLTPLWAGIHDGSFDVYDSGVSAGGFGGLESLAEDGVNDPLMTRFEAEQSASGGVNGTLTAETVAPPPFNPGESSSFVLSVANTTTNRYFSYASMVIPSNDAFVANGDPLAHAIFDATGNYSGPVIIEIFGSQVLDAGTEVNAEVNAAFLDQTGPNMGADEGGVVGLHQGFNGSVGNPGGTPVNILGGTTASGANIDLTLGDFTRNAGGDLIARITVVPEPSSMALSIAAFVALLTGLRKRTSHQ